MSDRYKHGVYFNFKLYSLLSLSHCVAFGHLTKLSWKGTVIYRYGHYMVWYMEMEDYRIAPLHEHPEQLLNVVDLLNEQWPRSRAAR